jgi:hypothetical protein
MPVAILENNGGAALDTVQIINSVVSTPASAWGSTIPTTFTAPGLTLTLPTIALADVGKSITVQNAGTFAFTLAIASGAITSAIGLIINPSSTFVIKAISITSAIVTSPTAAQNVVPENGTTVNTTGNTSYPANSALVTFTLPSVGRFDVDAQIGANFSAVGSGNLYIRTSAGVEVPNSRVYVQNGSQGAMAAPIHIGALIDNLVANTTYQVWTAVAWAAVYGYDTPTPAQGGTKIIWNKISGLLPVTGQSVDYGSLTASGNASYGTVMYSVTTAANISPAAPFASNQTILFNGGSASVVQNGNLPVALATGIQTINKTGTYSIKISASLQANGASDSTVLQLVKNNTTPIAASSGFNASGGNIVTQHNLTYSGTLNAGDTLDVRVGANGVAAHAVYAFSWTTTQLGTFVSTKTTLAKVQGTFSGALSGSNLLLGGIFDPTGAWNNTTGLFTAPRTADYLIAGGIAYQNTNTYTNGYEILYLGGASNARIAWGYHGVYTGYWGMSGAITVRLTAGQTIGINCTKTNLIQTGVDSNISITELPNDFVN